MRLVFVHCPFASIFISPIRATGQAPHQNSQSSPVGRWDTVDDSTGKVNSVVLIWEANGKLYGKIEKLIDPDPRDPDPRCNRCEGQLIIGLQILWDLHRDDDQWSGGKVLDPDNGNKYKCYVVVEDGDNSGDSR
jgi:hypothetical protein